MDAKDAIIAEYTALRTEICQRVSTKEKTVISWLLILTGGLIGVLLKVNIPGMGSTLINALVINQFDENVMIFLSVIIIGYVLAVLLLISYSHYQLYMAFRLSDFIIILDKRIRKLLNFKKKHPLFAWEKESRGAADINLSEFDCKEKKDIKNAINIASKLDLITPFIMACGGLNVIFLIGIIAVIKSFFIISIVCFISLLIFLLLLFKLYLVDKYLHLWVQRTGAKRTGKLDERKNAS